jgi:hypothetical protein
LKDKHGQPLYEGSIVRRKNYIGIVFYDPEAKDHYVNRAGQRYDEHGQMLASIGFTFYPPHEWRVIGHIDDQPPL